MHDESMMDPTAKPLGDSCRHFSIGHTDVSVAGVMSPMKVSSPTCAISEVTVDSPYPGFPPISYGPDAVVVTRETCTPERFAAACGLAIIESAKMAGTESRTQHSRALFRSRSHVARAREMSRRARAASERHRCWAREASGRARDLMNACAESIERSQRLCRATSIPPAGAAR